MASIILQNEQLYLSYDYLKTLGITQKDLENWSYRKISEKAIFNGQTFLLYNSIPEKRLKQLPTKENLIATYHANKHDENVEHYYNAFLYQTTKGWIQYREQYKDAFYNLKDEKLNQTAKLHAVWQYVKDNSILHERNTKYQYLAFDKIFPKHYKSYNCFANVKAKVLKNGAASCYDNRNRTAKENVPKIKPVNEYWAASLISLGSKLNNRQVHEKIVIACEKAGIKPPSQKWVEKYRTNLLRGNIVVYKSRYGAKQTNNKMLPFLSVQQALNIHDCWMIDGWTMPFFVKDSTGSFKRYSLVIVMDSYSKKIIGFSVAESENTISIMEAYKDAIINTECLPFEIVSDNHSFNKTTEAANFKTIAEKIGVTFTVTSNPQHKNRIERSNKYLDALCRDYYGYTGEGLRAKSDDARPKDELLTQYAATQTTVDEVKLIAIKIVTDFNNQIQKATGKTPNERYAESKAVHSFKVSLADRIQLLTTKTTAKVSRGQITIKRGGFTYQYKLSASHYAALNNTTVAVYYEDLTESIYVYDNKTDDFITEVKIKSQAHGAIANQSDNDIVLLNKNKGRLKGIETQARKKLENLRNAATEAHPDAYELLDPLTTPKDIIATFRENSELKRMAADKGVNLENAYVPERHAGIEVQALKPVKKVNESPFTPKTTAIHMTAEEYLKANQIEIDED